jgi:hypothetical protein
MSDEYENLVAECKEEIRVFERPQARNSIALIDAVEQLQKENAEYKGFLKLIADECEPWSMQDLKALTSNKEE